MDATARSNLPSRTIALPDRQRRHGDIRGTKLEDDHGIIKSEGVDDRTCEGGIVLYYPRGDQLRPLES